MTARYLAAVLVISACTGCSRQPAAGEAPAPAAPVQYSEGFFAQETNDAGSWRWMGPTGVVSLANTHEPMVLTIRGQVPSEKLSEPPVVTIALNGEVLDTWQPNDQPVEREYLISPEQQGTEGRSELRIASSQSFIPNERDPQSTDRRRLALIVGNVGWERR